MGELALALDGQQAILHRDVEVVGLDPGQLDRHQVGVLTLRDVQRRRPGRGRTAALLLAVQAERAGEHRAQLGHLVLRAAQVLEWVPSHHGGHLVSLVSWAVRPGGSGRTQTGWLTSAHLPRNYVQNTLNSVQVSRTAFTEATGAAAAGRIRASRSRPLRALRAPC